MAKCIIEALTERGARDSRLQQALENRTRSGSSLLADDLVTSNAPRKWNNAFRSLLSIWAAYADHQGREPRDETTVIRKEHREPRDKVIVHERD
jgi:hypothetical protein